MADTPKMLTSWGRITDESTAPEYVQNRFDEMKKTLEVFFTEQAHAVKFSEAAGIEKGKEMMTQEIKDLQREIEARKHEVNSIFCEVIVHCLFHQISSVREDLELERRERESLDFKYHAELSRWKGRERNLEELLNSEKSKLEERIRQWDATEQSYLQKLDQLSEECKALTYKAEQSEVLCKDQVQQVRKLQQELVLLRNERDTLQADFNEEQELHHDLKHRSVSLMIIIYVVLMA